jgi:hypothetical protein
MHDMTADEAAAPRDEDLGHAGASARVVAGD